VEAVPKKPTGDRKQKDGLQLRGGRYYYRRKVPAELVKVIGKREVLRALNTSDFVDALDRYRVQACEVAAEFSKARRRLNAQTCLTGPIKPVADPEPQLRDNPIHISTVSDPELRQIILEAFAGWERRAAEMRLLERLDEHNREEALRNLAHEEALFSGSLTDESVAQEVEYCARRILTEKNIIADGPTRQYRLVLDITQRALLESTRRDRQRYQGVYTDHSFDPLFSGIGAYAAPQAEQSITLDDLIERFKADPGRADRRNKTFASYEFTFRMLREVIGRGTAVRRITREDCRRVRDLLTTLPPNATKRFPKMTLAQAAEHARTHALPPLNAKTAQKHLAQISALFRWAVAEEFMPTHPAERLTVASTGPKRKARRPYSIEQLNSIFRAPLFMGCEDGERGYAVPGPNRPRRGRFWVPLISLWMGLRLNECCQLHVADVRVLDGVVCIIIQEADEEDVGEKRVKTEAGERYVPVHPELKRIGFLEFVAAQREAGGGRLFPELKRGAHGYLSDNFQKWWARFIKKIGANRPRTSFHSFRHCYRDALREAGISIERARLLGGWSRGEGADAGYGDGLRPSTLAREIGKVRYPDLDLSHLYLQPVANSLPAAGG
jgi:integrase